MEAALGEARCYAVLCAMPEDDSGAAGVAQHGAQLAEGVREMARTLGSDHAVVGSVLREHNR